MSQPNVLVIVADDLGFRSMLMSGTDNHLAGLGQMAETTSRNPLYQGRPGYEGILNDRVAALPEILASSSYQTIMSGKWHLGLTREASPWTRGFRESFSLLPGAGNHYAFEPLHADGAIKFMPPLYMKDENFISPGDLPRPFYSSDAFADKLLEFLNRHHASTSPSHKRSFFAYLPFTAPHWPLQAPPEITAKYAGRYDAGPNVLRSQRLESLAKLGLIPEDITPHPIVPAYDSKDWDQLTDDERLYSARTMEVYAAMVERQLENTLVFFSSDNGAEGALLEAIPIMGERISKTLKEHYNNSYENIGNADSFVWYGPRWAQAATAPSRMYKAWITEGGIRCPAIIRYPKAAPHRQNGAISHVFTTVMDILPTILELAGIPHPTAVGDGKFQGRTVLPPRGRSWVPYLLGETEAVHADDAVHGWELFGQGAIRRGPWKALWMPQTSARHGVKVNEETTQWELFNLTTDPGETTNIAKENPEILAELVQHWVDYVAETGTILVIPEGDQKPVSLTPGYGPLL